MRSPAVSVPPSMTVDAAARCLVGQDLHHLIVVDSTGAAIGMLSILDVLRALLGIPPHHPPGFPHWDESTETSWTDDWPLTEENLAHAPDEAGVLALITEQPGIRDAMISAEPCTSLRSRVENLIRGDVSSSVLAQSLASGNVCFRTTVVQDDSRRERIARLLRDRLNHVPPPGAT